MSEDQRAKQEPPPPHYIEDNAAHFALKAKWKDIPGNRYTPDEIRNSDARERIDRKRAETDKGHWPGL